MAIEQITRKIEKIRKVQKNHAERETPISPKKDNGPNESKRKSAANDDVDL